MHDSLFRHFAVKGVIVEDDQPDTDVDVILNFGVEAIDEYNEVIERVDKADFRNTQIKTKRGQLLVVGDGEFSGEYMLGKKLKSNGYIEAREITRKAA